jgi:hypothetical protein
MPPPGDQQAADDYAARMIAEVGGDEEVEPATAVPREKGEYRLPFNERPWTEQFVDVVGNPVDKARSYFENAGNTFMANTADEIGAQILSPSMAEGVLSTMRPEDRHTYAAGSQNEDARRTLEAERLERDDQNPVPALAGKMAGGVAAGALIPGGAVAQTVGGAGLMATDMLGAGHGDLSQRADQAVETAKENPLMTGLALAMPAVAPGIARGAGAVQKTLQRGANRNTVAAVMTPPQRNALINNLGPEAVERLGGDMRAMKLQEMPWYEFWRSPNAETFYDNAVKARKVAEQGLEETESAIAKAGDPDIKYTPVAEDLEGAADEVMKRADKSAATKEADFSRELAGNYRGSTKQPAAGPIQEFAEEQPFSREITAPSEVQPAFQKSGGGRNVVAPSEAQPAFQKSGGGRNVIAPSEVQPTFFPSGASRQAPDQVPPAEWFDYLNKVKVDPNTPPPAVQKGGFFEGPERPPEFTGPDEHLTLQGPERPPEFTGPDEHLTLSGPERPPEFTGPDEKLTLQGPNRPPVVTRGAPLEAETGVRPFSEAQADLRYNNRQVDFSRQGGGPDAPMQEQVRRRLGTKLREGIHTGLDDAVGTGQLDADVVTDWKKHKKNYGTAAAVEDPAQALMQKDYGGSMGLKDLAGASMLSTFGLGGPAALATTKAMQGRWPGWRANRLEGMANEFGAAKGLADDVAENAGMIRGAATPHPIAAAREENPDAPKKVVVQKANDSLKEQLQEAMKEGSDWFRSLID